MKFGIISDIHANLPALEAVIKDMKTHHLDHIICLGDIIGYGPFPAECLKRVREITNYIIMGNHEAAAAGLFDVDLFNDEAKEHILWTIDQLSKEELTYIKGLHYMLDFETFMVSHGAFVNPDCFAYIETEEEAKEVFAANELKLMFIGHTHFPIIHRIDKGGKYAAIEKDEVKLNPASRYIINPGAVGLSRDKEFSAGYVIFDSDLHKVFMRRVNYSLKSLYDAVKAMARDKKHLAVLMERFKPQTVMTLGKSAKISKSGLMDAVERHREKHK